MAASLVGAATTFLRNWAPILNGLSDPVLLLDGADCLVACSRAARTLLGSSVDVAGTPVHSLLGLAATTALDGPAALGPPASGLRVAATLRRTALYDEQHLRQGSLLLIIVEAVDEQDSRRESLEGRLREVALTISSALDIREILDQVVLLTVDLFGAAGGALPLYDTHFDRLLPSHVVGINVCSLTAPFYRGIGAIWNVVDTGESYLNNCYAAEPTALSDLLEVGVHAVAAAPVRAGDQVLGVLCLYHIELGRRFSRRDVELLEMIGRHTGVALQNASRYQMALRESARRQLLYKASLAFGAALAPEQLYQSIHRTVAEMMPCDTIAIALVDPAAEALDYVYMADGRGRWPNERLPLGRGLLGSIIRTGISLRVTGCDPAIEAMFGAEPFGDGEDGTGSLLAATLLVGEQTVGAITVQAVASDAYTAEDLDVLETLAATAAIALQNAHLFARVQELATTDPLTGVANRRHFFELARLEVERAIRYGRALSLLMIDADHFKRINDQYGHVVGDEVLQAIARRCRGGLREIDTLARYGGEEFLILLPETNGAQALQAADRLRHIVGDEPVPTLAGFVPVKISIGIASMPAGSASTVEALLDQADQALYAAKAAGRDQARTS